jgi:hypothetical protein
MLPHRINQDRVRSFAQVRGRTKPHSQVRRLAASLETTGTSAIERISSPRGLPLIAPALVDANTGRAHAARARNPVFRKGAQTRRRIRTMPVFDLLGDEQIARLQKTAAEARAVPVAFFKFENSIWTMGGDNVTDSMWLALTDLAMVGWKRFEGKRVVEEFMRPIIENDNPPRPNTYTDRDQWPKGNGGWPMDPWSKQFALPLLNEKTGKIAIFNASTLAAKTAFSALLDDFAEKRRRQVVALSSEIVRVNDKDVHEPKFEIIEHSENDAPINFAAGKQAPEKNATTVKANGGGDMDDDIPF